MQWLLTEDHKALQKKANLLALQIYAVRKELKAAYQDEKDFQKHFDAVLAGFPHTEDLKIRRVPELGQQFDKLRPPINTMSFLDDSNKEVVKKACFDLIAEKHLREKVLALPTTAFDDEVTQTNGSPPKITKKGELTREHDKSKWQLKNWREGMAKAGHDKFNPDLLFQEMGIGYGRVMKSRPVFAPYFATSGISQGRLHEKNVPWLMETFIGKISDTGLNYGLGFIERDIKDRQNENKKLYIPLVCLDRKVFHALTDMHASPQKEKKLLAANLLTGLRNFFSLSIHDYVHQSMYEDTLQLSDNRFKLHPGNPPIYNNQQKTLEDSRTIWPQHLLLKNEMETVSLEKHAELQLRDTYHQFFETEKGKAVKNAILRQAVTFLDNLETFRQLQTKTHGKDETDKAVTYLALVALSRFHRIISMDDPDLTHQRFMLPSKKKLSFKEAAEQLKIPPYSPTLEDVNQTAQLDPSINDKTIPRATLTEIDKKQPGSAYVNFATRHIVEKKDTTFWRVLTDKLQLDDPYYFMNRKRQQCLLKAALILADPLQLRMDPMKLINLQEYVRDVEHNVDDAQKKNSENALILANMGFKPNSEEWEILKQIVNSLPKSYQQAEPFLSTLAKDLASFIVDYQKQRANQITSSYGRKRLEALLGHPLANEEKAMANQLMGMQITGMDGLHMRTLHHMSGVPGWLNSYGHWNDPIYPSAERAQAFFEVFTDPKVMEERPEFAAKIKTHRESHPYPQSKA